MKTIITNTLLFTVIAIVIEACTYKDLEEYYDIDNSKRDVIIHYDWSHVDSIPAGMRLIFFKQGKENTKYGQSIYDIPPYDCAIKVAEGSYDLVSYNNDIEHVLMQNNGSYDKLYGTTLPYNTFNNNGIQHILDSVYPGQRVLDYPDYMVHSIRQQVRIDPTDNMQYIDITPDSMVMTIDIKLRGIAGLDVCTRFRGVLDSISSKRYVAEGKKCEDHAAVLFEAQTNANDSTITAHFWVFGVEPRHRKLLTFFWLTNAKVFFVIDLDSPVIRKTESDNHMSIEIPDLNINLRDYLNKSSGFSVDADDWSDSESVTINF